MILNFVQFYYERLFIFYSWLYDAEKLTRDKHEPATVEEKTCKSVLDALRYDLYSSIINTYMYLIHYVEEEALLLLLRLFLVQCRKRSVPTIHFFFFFLGACCGTMLGLKRLRTLIVSYAYHFVLE